MCAGRRSKQTVSFLYTIHEYIDWQNRVGANLYHFLDHSVASMRWRNYMTLIKCDAMETNPPIHFCNEALLQRLSENEVLHYFYRK